MPTTLQQAIYAEMDRQSLSGRKNLPSLDQLQELLTNLPNRALLEGIGSRRLQQYENRVPAEIKQPIEQGLNNALQTLHRNFAGYVHGISTSFIGQALQILNP